ncbi:MAG: hypothetical protein WC087_03740 [Candidatus Paceibacterota bacterium]
MKRILIFEDDLSIIPNFLYYMEEEGFEVAHVANGAEFTNLFSKDKNWDVIIFDAWIDADMETTYKFVEWVREELKDQVKLVANSSSGTMNKRLMTSGCDVQSGNFKLGGGSLVSVVKSLLNL